MTTNKPFFTRHRLWGLLGGLTLAAAQLFIPASMGTAQAAATTTCTPNGLVHNCTVTFAYTGAAETWTVPEAVTQVTFNLYGAQGGWSSKGGKGGQATATFNVTAGAVYYIVVGGAGGQPTAGFNGGANSYGNGGGGGGATDVRTNPTALNSRILVAGGGGGSYGPVYAGGIGGNETGGTGMQASYFANPGLGGTRTAGGKGGTNLATSNYNGKDGAWGQGGVSMGGGGGGGGYYGGGGGGKAPDSLNPGAGGGGGSSYGPTGASFNAGVQAGNGKAIITYTLQKTATTTTITADNPDPSVVGQAVSVAFTVAPIAAGAGTPTGNVTVTDGTNACTAPVAAGQCSLPFTSVGAKTLKATYAGDAKFTGSTSVNAAHTVNKAETTATITANTPNPSTVGQPVTVNYQVAASAPGAGLPTGNVTVSDGVDSCTAPIAAGSCVITLSSYGNHTLKASYAGDSNFNASTSADMPQIVNQNESAITLTAADPNPSVVGGTVIVHYSVTPSTATGNVGVFTEDGVDSCTGTVAEGQCTLTITNGGMKLLTASYTGDDNFFPSTSAAVEHNVLNQGTATIGSTGGAVAAADTSAVTATQPLTGTAMAESAVITPSVPVSAAAPVAAAPVITASEPVSAPTVVNTPVVADTPAVAAVDATPTPADANAQPSDTAGQNQQIFLPLVQNLAGAALSSPGGIAILVLVVLGIGGILWRRRARPGA